MPLDPEDVLRFWFDPAVKLRWFDKDLAFDDDIRQRFGEEHAAALRGERESWLLTPRGRLAYVLVLDQFTRNLYRNRPEMFSGDERALRAAKAGVAAGDDQKLTRVERSFLYMPYMHSEAKADQEQSVQLFKGTDSESWAIMHRDIIQRFGRFPHRNQLLGRSSTPEEIAFLKTPGSSF